MNLPEYIISPLAALLLSPLLAGIINRTKAFFAGRKGQHLFQVYFDLARLFRKDYVFSKTTSWIFRVSPVIIFTATLASTCFVPFISSGTRISFAGDLVLMLYLLALARFFLIISALDTGSSFEGMGASREAFFSVMTEPVIFTCLLSIMRANGTVSITEALSAPMLSDSISVLLSALPLFFVLLAENSRIPFDDPNTHLELTMIHEVMILDNSGPGLGLLEYSASVKLWLFSLILGRILLPSTGMSPFVQTLILLAIMGLIAVVIGTVESVMARIRLIKVPQMLFGAGVAALLGFFINVTKAIPW